MSSFKILICGDRFWTRDKAVVIHSALRPFKPKPGEPHPKVIHGGARGADEWGCHVARALDFDVEDFPAQWKRHGLRAGPIRNQLMLAQHPDLVMAFHDDIESSTGTRDMVNRALRAGGKVVVHHSNGESREL